MAPETEHRRATPPPNSCRWCGIEKRAHGQRWSPEAGWHLWAEPSTALRRERMRARRENRHELPAD